MVKKSLFAYIKVMEQKEISDTQEALQKPSIREQTLEKGLAYPSDEELLMLILGRGTKRTPVEKLSRKVMEVVACSSKRNLVGNLLKLDGMGTSRALQVAAALELGRRHSCYTKNKISRPADVIPFVQHYSLSSTERFITVTLNGAKEILAIRVISVGTTNKTFIHPREIFAEAVAEHASAIICCHNHPSGPCEPSEPDLRSTQVLQRAASILGITLLDHIIINTETYFSFLEHDML